MGQVEKGMEIKMCELLDKYWNQGVEQGIKQGEAKRLTKSVDSLMANMSLSLQQACESIGSTVEEYMRAKRIQAT